MDLTMYKPNELEQWIESIYRKHRILYAHEMDIDHIADFFCAEIRTNPVESKVIWDDDFALIYLWAYLSEEQRREQFFHELGHVLRHDGNQHCMPPGIKQLQENEANVFQMYAAIPAYLLQEFTDIRMRDVYIKFVAEEFRYSPAFVQRRIEQIERRIYQAEVDREFRAATTPVRIFYDHSPETNRLLSQLYRQTKKQKGLMNNA